MTHENDESAAADAGMQASALKEALATLTDDQRRVIELVLAGHSEAEVATTLQVPRSQVAATCAAAMRVIRERLPGSGLGRTLPTILTVLALASC